MKRFIEQRKVAKKLLNDKNDFMNLYIMTLNQNQKDLIVGTLLGDGNLQTETKGRTWRYRALHKAAHKDYLFYKYELLKNFCQNPPCYSEVHDTRTDKFYRRWYFQTSISNAFKHYGNLFYTFDLKTNRMVKKVPINIQQLLTPLAVAYWYMDDGSMKWIRHSNAIRICTESFSESDVSRLKKALKNLYNIETQLIRKTNNGVFIGYRLAINEANSTCFRQLIEPFLIDCMRYKVSDGNKNHL